MTKSRQHSQIGLALFLLFFVAAFDYLVQGVRAGNAVSTGSNGANRPAQIDSVQMAEGLSQTVRDAIEEIRPSLVTISSPATSQFSPLFPQRLPELWSGDAGSLIHRIFQPSVLRSDSDREKRGTGVIVSENGLIWTSTDVVRDLNSVNVTLQSESTYEGKVLLRDQESGLAIIKIDADNLPAAQFENAAQPKVADWAIAVALDDHQEPILASGLISNFSLKNSNSHTGIKSIRCAFSIAGEFSGGPLINMNGELLGINTTSSLPVEFVTSSGLAVDVQSASTLQRKINEGVATDEKDFNHETSSVDDSSTIQKLTRDREVKQGSSG